MQSSGGLITVSLRFRLKNCYRAEEEADFRFDKNVLFYQKYRTKKYSLQYNHVEAIVIHVIYIPV